jgi:hypothetical protein
MGAKVKEQERWGLEEGNGPSNERRRRRLLGPGFNFLSARHSQIFFWGGPKSFVFPLKQIWTFASRWLAMTFTLENNGAAFNREMASGEFSPPWQAVLPSSFPFTIHPSSFYPPYYIYPLSLSPKEKKKINKPVIINRSPSIMFLL